MSDETFKNNPFGALKGTVPELQGLSPSPASNVIADKATVPAVRGQSPRTIPRAVVRMERSGRGGKEVTVIEHMALSPKEREDWLKALKAGLGCGGVVEGDALMLQGDQRTRVPKLLEARGVKKITIG